MNGRMHATPALVLWLIHLSFIIAIPIYALLMFVLPHPELASPRGGSGLSRPLLLSVLVSLSVIQLAFALSIGRWLRPEDAQAGDADRVPIEGQGGAYLRRRTVQVLISDALIEAVAIYGLIGFFLGLTAGQALGFMVVALVLLLARVSQLRHWTDEYNHLTGGGRMA